MDECFWELSSTKRFINFYLRNNINIIYSCNDIFHITKRARSLVVSDLRLGAKGYGSSPAANYVQRWAFCGNRPANV